MRENLFEAKDGFQVIRSGWRVVGMIFPDGTRINIGDKIITKKNCVVEAGREGEVVKFFWPHVSPRTTDVVYVRFNGDEFPLALKPEEFEIKKEKKEADV